MAACASHPIAQSVGAVGAAGAPGFNLDEGCARAGLEKVRDRLK
jgi:uncharacterized protein GlcG (DUF336 family)